MLITRAVILNDQYSLMLLCFCCLYVCFAWERLSSSNLTYSGHNGVTSMHQL